MDRSGTFVMITIQRATLIILIIILSYGQNKAQSTSSHSSKSNEKMQVLIDQNWEQLAKQLPDYNRYSIREIMSEIDPKKVGAIAAKAFEVEGQSVKLHAFVYSTFEKRDAALKRFKSEPPFMSKKSYNIRNHHLLITIYTTREDEDAQWIVWELAGVLGLAE
jgi:hypothetical protein